MIIWNVSAYDQPRGNSSRSFEYSTYLVNNGHKVIFFTNDFCHFTKKYTVDVKTGSLHEVISGVDVVWLKTNAYHGNGASRTLNMIFNYYRVISESSKFDFHKPDVVLGPSVPLLTGFAAAMLAQRYGSRFVFEIRDVWPEALVLMGAMKRSSLGYLIFRYLEKYLYKNADIIISTLPFVDDHIRESISSTKDVVYIPNPVDFELYEPPCDFESLSTKSKINVTYIGGFGVDHDVDMIFKMAKALYDENNNDFVFHLIGDGVKKNKLQRMIKNDSLPNIILHEPITKNLVRDAQCGSDILIAAITNTESYKFGLNLNKLCGYMASRKPILLLGSPPNNPIEESNSWFTVASGKLDEAIFMLKKIQLMPDHEIVYRGDCAFNYAKSHLGLAQLGDKMNHTLKSVMKN